MINLCGLRSDCSASLSHSSAKLSIAALVSAQHVPSAKAVPSNPPILLRCAHGAFPWRASSPRGMVRRPDNGPGRFFVPSDYKILD
jgi:hypothetical protein